MCKLLRPAHQLQLEIYWDVKTKTPMLPPVPLNTKIDETNLKAHVMRLYPDLFDGVGTIKNAVVHLDVKPGAIPIVCSSRRVPDRLRDSLKEELDRMEPMKDQKVRH